MKTKLLRVLALTLALLSLSLAFSACSSNPAKDLGDIVYVEIDMESGDYIKLELYPKIAPITVANFVKLCNEHFYDGIIFHRVIPNFMVMGGSKEEIKGEFSANGVKNDISHVRGVISMARLGENPYTGEKNYDSASSQFFIVHEDCTGDLNMLYAAFGFVTEGMEVVDKICSEAEPTDYNGTIEKDDQPIITSIKIYTPEEYAALAESESAESESNNDESESASE